MQMAQFCTMIAQASMMMLSSDKAFPPRMTLAYFFYIISMLVLFAQFFVQSYTKKPSKSKSA